MGSLNFGLAARGYTTAALTDIVNKYGVAGTVERNSIRLGTLVRDTTTGGMKVYNGSAFVVGTSYTPPVALANTVLPTITNDGTPAVGETLGLTNGTWTGTPAPVFSYQWNVNGAPVPGATGATFVSVAGSITVTVTATNYLGSVSATSAALVQA